MTDITALMYRDKHQRELRELPSPESHAAKERYYLMNDDGEFVVLNQDVEYGLFGLECGSLGYAYPNRHEQLWGGTVWDVECVVLLDDGFNYDLSPDCFDIISYEEYKARSEYPRMVQAVTSEPVSKGDVVYVKDNDIYGDIYLAKASERK